MLKCGRKSHLGLKGSYAGRLRARNKAPPSNRNLHRCRGGAGTARPAAPQEHGMASQTYTVDLDPGQIVPWIMAELEANPTAFRVSARRAREVREIPAQSELRLGDEEREDLREAATTAVLEIGPAHAAGWRLIITIEDEIGPQLLDEGGSGGDEQDMRLAAFYKEFIRPGRGNAYVSAEVDSPAARARLTRLLNAIEQNRHNRKSNAKP